MTLSLHLKQHTVLVHINIILTLHWVLTVLMPRFYPRCIMDNHRIILYLKNNRKKKIRTSQAQMEEILCSNDSFVTCTKGIIVNLEYVQRIDDSTVFLMENYQVPVSRRRMAEIRKAHAAYLFRQVRL